MCPCNWYYVCNGQKLILKTRGKVNKEKYVLISMSIFKVSVNDRVTDLFKILLVYFFDLCLEKVLILKSPNPQTCKKVDATPIRFFLNFSKAIYYLQLPFSVAMCMSFTHIPTKFGENRFLWLRNMAS